MYFLLLMGIFQPAMLVYQTGWCSTPTLLRPFARHLLGKMDILAAHLLLTKRSPAEGKTTWRYNHKWSTNKNPLTFHVVLVV